MHINSQNIIFGVLNLKDNIHNCDMNQPTRGLGIISFTSSYESIK